MRCLIELIDFNKNKSVKQKYISGSYAECEDMASELNKSIKTDDKKWIVTKINI